LITRLKYTCDFRVIDIIQIALESKKCPNAKLLLNLLFKINHPQAVLFFKNFFATRKLTWQWIEPIISLENFDSLLPFIDEKLKGSGDNVRIQIINYNFKSHKSNDIQYLLKLLDDPNIKIQSLSLNILKEFKDPSIIESLIKKFQSIYSNICSMVKPEYESSQYRLNIEVLKDIISILCNFDDQRIIFPFKEILHDQNVELHLPVIRLLSKIDNYQSYEEIFSYLKLIEKGKKRFIGNGSISQREVIDEISLENIENQEKCKFLVKMLSSSEEHSYNSSAKILINNLVYFNLNERRLIVEGLIQNISKFESNIKSSILLFINLIIQPIVIELKNPNITEPLISELSLNGYYLEERLSKMKEVPIREPELKTSLSFSILRYLNNVDTNDIREDFGEKEMSDALIDILKIQWNTGVDIITAFIIFFQRNEDNPDKIDAFRRAFTLYTEVSSTKINNEPFILEFNITPEQLKPMGNIFQLIDDEYFLIFPRKSLISLINQSSSQGDDIYNSSLFETDIERRIKSISQLKEITNNRSAFVLSVLLTNENHIIADEAERSLRSIKKKSFKLFKKLFTSEDSELNIKLKTIEEDKFLEPQKAEEIGTKNGDINDIIDFDKQEKNILVDQNNSNYIDEDIEFLDLEQSRADIPVHKESHYINIHEDFSEEPNVVEEKSQKLIDKRDFTLTNPLERVKKEHLEIIEKICEQAQGLIDIGDYKGANDILVDIQTLVKDIPVEMMMKESIDDLFAAKGFVLYQLKGYCEAKKFFKEATRINPENETAIHYLNDIKIRHCNKFVRHV